MSDPNQLVELVYCKASQSKTKTPLNNDANAAEVNPFIVPSPKSAQNAPSLTRGNASIGGADASSAVAAAAVPAPSAIELQSLLLAVATAEGVSKIQALRKQGDGSGGAGDGPEGAESGGKGDGAAERGVRGAAMEMLERLTNQLISTCVVAHFIVAFGCPCDPRWALNGDRLFVRFRLGTVACPFRCVSAQNCLEHYRYTRGAASDFCFETRVVQYKCIVAMLASSIMVRAPLYPVFFVSCVATAGCPRR